MLADPVMGLNDESGIIRERNYPGFKISKHLTSDVAYLVCGLGAKYKIDCCGYSTGIQFYRDATGLATFQIWRPIGGTTYELIGTVTDNSGFNSSKSATWKIVLLMLWYLFEISLQWPSGCSLHYLKLSNSL